MQKRSFPLQIQYAPISLDAALPIQGGAPFVQQDRPITFLHVHDCLEIGYCYSGSGVFMVGEKVLPFAAGDVSFINHTEVHLAQSAPGTASEWTWIYLDPVRLVRHPDAQTSRLDPTPLAGPRFANLLRAERHPALARAVLRMIDELRHDYAGRADALRALTWELMTLMHRQRPPARGTRPTRQQYDRLAPALQYLAQRYVDPVDISKLADRCGMSQAHFRRVFVGAIGRSPRAYWLDLRLRMAVSLLRSSSRSVLQISQDVGFDTLSSFNRQFRTAFDTTPRSWRKG